MRAFLFIFMIVISGFALDIDDFQSDLYSKEGRNIIKKISLSLIIEGRYANENENAILDSLNVIIGSYFVEDILTSNGKEMFKKNLIAFLAKKHSVDIDQIYIKKLYIVNDTKVDEIIEALRRNGCCQRDE